MAHTSTVYLLHFDPPYVAPIGNTGRSKMAGHYVGSTAGSVEERLAEHLAGRGSPLVRAAVAAPRELRLSVLELEHRPLAELLRRTGPPRA